MAVGIDLLHLAECFLVDFRLFLERFVFDDEIFDDDCADFSGREPKAARRTATASSPTSPRSAARVFDGRFVTALRAQHNSWKTRLSQARHISSKVRDRARGNYAKGCRLGAGNSPPERTSRASLRFFLLVACPHCISNVYDVKLIMRDRIVGGAHALALTRDGWPNLPVPRKREMENHQGVGSGIRYGFAKIGV